MQGDERKPAGPEFRMAEVFRALQLAGLSATMRFRGSLAVCGGWGRWMRERGQVSTAWYSRSLRWSLTCA